jgi:hypothetical protein
MRAGDIAKRLDAKPTPSGWAGKCPAHDDGRASLTISEGKDGRTLLYCHAGCSIEAITMKLGLRLSDLFVSDKPQNYTKQQFDAVYDYKDESGTVLFQVCRMFPKDFRQRKPDGAGGWDWKTSGVRRVPFMLPELLAAVRDNRRIYIAEGEKDCLALVKAGFAATCNPGGAEKWRAEFAPYFAGAECIIIADKDGAGRRHAQQIAANLTPVAGRVCVIEVPDVHSKPCKDAADYFAAGGETVELDAIAEAAEAWKPQAEQPHRVEAETTDTADDVAAWIRGEIVTALTSRDESWKKHHRIAYASVQALGKLGRFYYHAEQRDFKSALFFNAQSKRLERIASDSFAAWLSNFVAVNRNDGHFKSIMTEVQNAALTGPHTSAMMPEAYWATRPGAIYLSNGDGQLVKITANDFKLADNGTDGVLFPVGKTLTRWQIVEPQAPFVTCSLFRNLHSIAPHGRTLLMLWAYSMPTNPRSKPPLALSGDVGSGKTRTAKGLAELYGLPFIATNVEEGSEDDFWPGLDAGGLFTLDNADTKYRWIADALAVAATDGCSHRRKLFTNSEQVLLRPRAWLAVTTANPTFASDAGLADRLLVVRMGRLDGETSDGQLSDEIAAARDAGLSHIAKTLAAALADNEPTPRGLNARHPDFAAFAVKIGRALDIKDEAIAALKAAEQDKSVFCLEHDDVAPAILAFVEIVGGFEGESRELLEAIRAKKLGVPENMTPRGLGKRLTALLPHFSKVLGVAKASPSRNGNKFTLQRAGLRV